MYYLHILTVFILTICVKWYEIEACIINAGGLYCRHFWPPFVCVAVVVIAKYFIYIARVCSPIVFFSTSGGIQSTPVPAKFSFEVTAKIEVLCVHVSYSVAINCKTNDPSANVSLSLPKHLPSHNLPSLQGRLKRNGAIFTIQKAILHDGGKYYCVAEKNGKVIKREIYLYVAGTWGIFHSYIL